MRRRDALLMGLFALGPSHAAAPPDLLLARVYQQGLPLADYWVSEKYDGVRGYWDGTRLHTRGGEPITPPAWFTAGWPTMAMDGELWAGRGKFAQAQSTVRSAHAGDAAWKQMRYMVFDLPGHPGTFDERLPELQKTVAHLQQSWVQAVPQNRVTSHEALHALLLSTVRAGGEGLMLHRGASLYRAGRSDDLIKVKTHDDTEAQVVAHLPGKGKHLGRMGALLVEMPGGQRFKLGAGFSNADRMAPPPVGSWVTYRFLGTHASGMPRFASFLRVREDLPPASAPAGAPPSAPPFSRRP